MKPSLPRKLLIDIGFGCGGTLGDIALVSSGAEGPLTEGLPAGWQSKATGGRRFRQSPCCGVRNEAGVAYPMALWGSAVIFGLVHVPGLSAVGVAVLIRATAGGLILGWLYWNWGLAHAVLCHLSAGILVQSLAPRLLR